MASFNPDSLTSNELLEAQSHLWNHIFSFINSFSLKCAVELGIADAINNHGKPITLTAVAAALSIPPVRLPNLQRLMTLLVHNGYFTQETLPPSNEAVYGLTPNSAVLVKDNGGATIVPYIELALDMPVINSWETLSAWMKSDQTSSPFELCHGVDFFGSVATMPEWGKHMRDGFGSDSQMVVKAIVEDHREMLTGVKTLLEVAGGMGGGGTIALAIAKKFPEIKCKVMDNAQLLDIVEKSHHLVDYVSGNFHEYIPPADALILKWVLFTWTDEECVKILKRCREAVPSKANGGKVILIESVMHTGDVGLHDPKLVETNLFYDLQVMVHMKGRVRTESEWKKLFSEAGFDDYKIVAPVGMRSIIEISHN